MCLSFLSSCSRVILPITVEEVSKVLITQFLFSPDLLFWDSPQMGSSLVKHCLLLPVLDFRNRIPEGVSLSSNHAAEMCVRNRTT